MSKCDSEQLKRYFSTTWLERGRSFDLYKYSGWALLDKVSAGESVLDVGCGNNLFKGKLDVFGIDPANTNADLMVTVEEFSSNRLFDVAFCHGSINFGSRCTIQRQIEAVISNLKPRGRIYWRCNPGYHDHGNSEFESCNVFPWSFERHRLFAEENGCHVADLKWDTNNRIYAEWRRK